MKLRRILPWIISVALLCSCSVAGQGQKANTDTKKQEESVEDKQALVRCDAAEEILSNASADFIGHHPIEDSFLFWVDKNYGGSILEEIANRKDYSDSGIWSELTGESIHVLWARYEKETGVGFYHTERIIWQEEQDSGEENVDTDTVIEFTGDLTLADNVATTLYMEEQQNKILDCFSEDLVEEMTSADLLVTNNVFAYTDRGEPLYGKEFLLRSIPSRVDYLKTIGVDVASLANNHVYDYGEQGLVDTLDTLDNAGVKTLGAGRDLEEASEPLYYIANGRKIAIVAATQFESPTDYTVGATENSPGVLKTLDSQKYVDVIKKADQNADIVICMTYWGDEGYVWHGNDQMQLANDFVEAGADAIIGSHTQRLQGIEYVNDKPVFYSLGNYLFTLSDWMPQQGYYTGLAKIIISGDGSIECEFVPCKFEAGFTEKLSDSGEAQSLYSYMNQLSITANINEAGKVVHR